jgi:hypothetical protein
MRWGGPVVPARASLLAGARPVASPSATSPGRWIARTALVFAGYVAAAVGLTWPLASVLSTHLPHTGGWFVSDLLHAGWALAWRCTCS